MTSRVRVGVIGAGSMGAWHAASFAALPGVELVGIAGRGLERAGRVAARLDARAVDDPRRLVEDPSLDALSVATPTATHRALVVAALEAGKHVLCETPLAADLADADAMLAASRSSGRHLLVNLTLRVVDECRRMREIVRAGELGAPLALTTSRLYPGNDADHHGDALLELALFDLDFALWTLGPADSVRAGGVVRADGWVDHVFVQLAHGATRTQLEASLALPPGFVFRASQRFVLEGGVLDSFIRFPPGALPESILIRYARGSEPTVLPPMTDDPMRVACEHFVRCARGETGPGDLSAGEARASLAVLEQARDSLTSEPGDGPSRA